MTADLDTAGVDYVRVDENGPADAVEPEEKFEGLLYGYHGEEIQVRDRVGIMPLLRFAHAAQSGLDSADLEGMAAMYDMLRSCFTSKGFDLFQDVATREGDDADELLAVVQDVIGLLTANPSGRRSGSSGGATPTLESSEAASSWRAYERHVAAGRTDLALVVYEVAKARGTFQN